jgi:hypothetical protein
MKSSDVLVDALSRIQQVVHDTVDGLGTADLAFRPAADANSIGWLVWHLTRVQDNHVADAAGIDQVWTAPVSPSWYDRFELPFSQAATGYGQRAADIAAVQVTADLLVGYHDAVFDQTANYLRSLTDSDLDRVVDEAWDPPVTLGVRLVSLISDDLQHAGQAAFLRGLLPPHQILAPSSRLSQP